MTSAPSANLTVPTGDEWWRHAVFYQVYVRSFADSGDDGVGDLPGIRARLPYLQELGVDALWITPFYPSPMHDHGYDVADPRDVEPTFGTLGDFDELITDAHRRGIKVTVDVVPNHTSDEHAWFVAALASAPGSPERARYLFRDGRGETGELPPNNWLSRFGGSAWERITEADGRPGQWYLHLFAPQQPDLDWHNVEVRTDLERTLRFWLDRGADGFRIDVAHGLAKPVDLPDMSDPGRPDAYANPDDPRFDNDDVHDIWRAVRRVLDDYPHAMAVGEVWVEGDERLARYVRPDELHLAFNFRLVQADWSATSFKSAVDDSIIAMAAVGAPTSWVLANHDVTRDVTRYGGGPVGRARARAAALLQLALPGVAYVYNGDELGLPNVDDLPEDVLQDPTWERSGHTDRGRDGCRIPLPWSGDVPPYGFSPDGTATWLPQPADWAGLTAAAQRDDPTSTLSLYRSAMALRRAGTALSDDQMSWQDAPTDCLALRRPGDLLCLVNFGVDPAPMPAGEVLVASAPVTDGDLPGNAAVWLRTTA